MKAISKKQRKLARKSVPKAARNEHVFSIEDYKRLPIGKA